MIVEELDNFGVSNFESNVRDIAEHLYKVCHDPHDYEVRVVWEDDSWAVNTNDLLQTGVRNIYYNKALKILTVFEDPREVKKMINFLNGVNPKVLDEFINSL